MQIENFNMCLQIFIHAFHHFRWPGRDGANDPDFPVDLSRSRATFRITEILYIFPRNCYSSQGDPDSSFPYLPCVWWCGTGGFQEQSQCFPVGMICFFFFIYHCFIFFFLPWVGLWGWGHWTDSVLTLSWPCTADSKIIIIITGNSYQDRRKLFQKILNFFFNNIIILILKRPKKSQIFQNSE